MLMLYGPRDTSFSLAITGYEFPRIVEGYDANWVYVDIEVAICQRTWKSHDPCLLTQDVIRLGQWFEQIRLGKPLPYRTFICDMDIEFQYKGLREMAHHFRVWFRWGCLPKWFKGSKFGIDIVATNNDLSNVIQKLEEAAQRFPPRGTLGQKWLKMLSDY